jgi:hypothetical protein
MKMPQKARQKARKLYVQDALPMGVIAKRLGVSLRTLQNWKAADASAGDDWGKARLAARLGKEAIKTSTDEYLQTSLEFQQKLLQDIKDSTEMSEAEKVAAIASLADALSKTVRSVAATAPAVAQLAIAGEVLQKLAAYVAANHPEAAPALLTVLEPFGAELVKAYG